MSSMTHRSINPETGELVAEFEDQSGNAVHELLAGFARGATRLRVMSLVERSFLVRNLGEILAENVSHFAQLAALEMGKPLAQGTAEVTKCATSLHYFADFGGQYLEPETRESDNGLADIRFDPLGPILAIMPWNFPFWQVFRVLGPSLLAGNPVFLKHAPNVPQCALAIEQACRKAGIDSEIFATLFADNEQVRRVILDDRIRGVTLTGSVRAGKQVGAIAGGAIKPLVLELGGSDPFIVLEDADIEIAAREGVASRCNNNGQVCISAKRFIVARSIYNDFTDRFVELMRQRKVGSPFATDTDNGPMARSDLRAEIRGQVKQTLDMGGKLLCGSELVPENGNFLAPTVLVDVPKESPAYREELFGPVATIIPFDSEQEAIQISNDTIFGLGASIWSRNELKALDLAPKIEAGSVFINETVKSDPHLPFGGVKKSGFGRELAKEGIRQFTNIKTVRVNRRSL